MAITTLDALSRSSAAALISGYQKHISPRKGFSCAYRVLHGTESCSQYVKRSILEQGLIEAIRLSKKRFKACKAAHQILKTRMQASETPEEEPQRRRENSTATCTDSATCAEVGCQSIECASLADYSGLDCAGMDCCSGADFCSCLG